MSPRDDATSVRPDAPLSVHVAHGSVVKVRVTSRDGDVVRGTRGAGNTAWTATSSLLPATTYTARVKAVNAAGKVTRSTTNFTTLRPKKRLTTSISPLDGQTLGVGMPIVVRLSEDVTRRAAVQRALHVSTSKHVTGSWSWIDDGELQWRPRHYWPSGTDVKLDVALSGVNAGGGVWGDETRTIRFSIGESMVSVVDVDAKTMTVRRGGEVVRTIPVSTGKEGYLTRNGIKVISEKYRTKIMDAATTGTSVDDPEYYRVEVEYALRITWSGEFVHAAPWSEGQQGSANVSHGCVGMSMADGEWFFEHSNVGDIVKVVNSPRELEPGNGYTAWNVPWKEWVAGSAV